MIKNWRKWWGVLAGLYLAIPLSHAEAPKIWFENDGGLSSDHITNGKIRVDHGFFGGYNLEGLIHDNPEAMALMSKQSKFQTYAHLSYWIGVIPSAGFFGYGVGSRDSTMTIVSAITLLGTALLTGHLVSQSRHYMHEAINTYNGVKKRAEASTPETTREAISQGTPLYSSNSNSNSNTIELSFSF